MRGLAQLHAAVLTGQVQRPEGGDGVPVDARAGTGPGGEGRRGAGGAGAGRADAGTASVPAVAASPPTARLVGLKASTVPDREHWSCVVQPQDPCPLCGLPLEHDDAAAEGRMSTYGSVRIFRCGHAYHSDCVVDDACVWCQSTSPWGLGAV